MAATLERLRASHVQGVIVVAPVRRVVEAVTRLEGDMPLVVVGGDPAIGAPTVTIDQFEGARMATRHLLDLGHRTVHHVAGPAELDRRHRPHAGLVRRAAHVPGAAADAPSPATGAPPRATPPALRLGQRPGRDGHLRRQRPDGARGDPGAARCRSEGARATSASSASTTRRNRATSCRRSPPSARTSARWAGAASSSCSRSPTATPAERHVVVPAELVVRASTAPAQLTAPRRSFTA